MKNPLNCRMSLLGFHGINIIDGLELVGFSLSSGSVRRYWTLVVGHHPFGRGRERESTARARLTTYLWRFGHVPTKFIIGVCPLPDHDHFGIMAIMNVKGRTIVRVYCRHGSEMLFLQCSNDLCHDNSILIIFRQNKSLTI